MSDVTTTQPGTTSASEDAKTKRERSSLTKVLPTDRVAHDKQIALLRAFAAVYVSNGGQPVTNDQAGDVISPKLSGSTVSQTNGFFVDVGLLTRSDKGGGLIPTTDLIDYNNACQWDEAEARLKLRPIFEKAWFYRCLVPRLQLSAQPQATCLALLASESKAAPEHNERLINLLSFLESSGVVSISGGTVSLLQHKQAPVDKTPAPAHGQVNPPPKTTVGDEHFLFLDSTRERKVVLQAPLEITRAEYDRICTWLEVVLIVPPESKGTA